MDFVIAVDGQAASGKGTLGAMLAADHGLPYLDTGLLYRAVAALVLEAGGDPDDAASAARAASAFELEAVADPALRGVVLGEAASRVAAHPEVRSRLLTLQRDFAGQPGGAVLDGRDIGTVVAPQAPAKLWVEAAVEVRAERRLRQLRTAGQAATLGEVLADLRRRDARDAGRASAPMARPPDSVLLDTTDLSIPQSADAARRIVEAARAGWIALREGGGSGAG